MESIFILLLAFTFAGLEVSSQQVGTYPTIETCLAEAKALSKKDLPNARSWTTYNMVRHISCIKKPK